MKKSGKEFKPKMVLKATVSVLSTHLMIKSSKIKSTLQIDKLLRIK